MRLSNPSCKPIDYEVSYNVSEDKHWLMMFKNKVSLGLGQSNDIPS